MTKPHLLLTSLLLSSLVFAQTPLERLDVSQSCNTNEEKKNAKVVLAYFKNEIWWNIGLQRRLFTKDFMIEHSSVLTRMAPIPALIRRGLQIEDGIFRHHNFLNGWTLIALANAREYYHLNFHQLICIGNRVIVTSEFSGLVVNRNRKGEVTHAVKYGSPVTHILLLKEEDGFQKMHRMTAVLQKNNMSIDANERLKKVISAYPKPQRYCTETLKNHKLGPKNSEKPIGVFDINPLRQSENPYRYDPNKKEQPLIECIDNSMTQTQTDIFNEFRASLLQNGFEYDQSGFPLP